MKEISFYEINNTFKENGVYFKSKKKIGTMVVQEEEDYIDIYSDIYDEIKYKVLNIEKYRQLYKSLELDKQYFIIEENPWNIIGVISLHKGYTFIDCANHDNRVIIKTAFPDKICNLVGECIKIISDREGE